MYTYAGDTYTNICYTSHVMYPHPSCRPLLGSPLLLPPFTALRLLLGLVKAVNRNTIGLELSVSVATIMTRGEPTCQIKTWAGDVVATAKRDLKAGEKLDGEGSLMVYGQLMPAADSIATEDLPIDLAHGIVLKRDVKKDQSLSRADVEYIDKVQAVALRKETESLFRAEFATEAKKVAGNGVNGVKTNGVNGVNGTH